jgi:predicted glutamine amidotransferase
MCGLAGAMSSFLIESEIKTFRDLMALAQFRGRDGSGVIFAPNNSNQSFFTLRSTMNADYLVNCEEFDKYLKDIQRPGALIGHARYPTSGGYDLDDCHPVTAGHIIGVHNGTMTKINGKAVGKDDHDSKLLFAAIAEHGIDTVIKNSAGAYAVVWVDKKDFTLNFLRNKDRTLYFGHHENNYGTIYWSSEIGMLEFVLARKDSRKIVIKTLPENHLLKFTLGTTQIRDTRTVAPEVSPNNNNVYRYTPPEQRSRRGSVPGIAQNPKNTVMDAAFADAAAKRGSPEAGEIHVQYGDKCQYVASKAQFELLLNNGCCVCGNPADYMFDFKQKKTHFINNDMWMCDDCVKRDPTTHHILCNSAGRAIH